MHTQRGLQVLPNTTSYTHKHEYTGEGSHTRLYAHSTIDTQRQAHSGWSCQVGAAVWKESRGRMEGTVNNNLSPQAELIPNCSTGLVLFVLQ